MLFYLEKTNTEESKQDNGAAAALARQVRLIVFVFGFFKLKNQLLNIISFIFVLCVFVCVGGFFFGKKKTGSIGT